MCGRYGYIESDFQTYGVRGKPEGYKATYKAFPTQRLPVILNKKGSKIVELYQWGLIPRWEKTLKPSYSTINARSETIFTSPVFRVPIRKQRCLVPANFYYEWRKNSDKTKTPFCIRLKSHAPMAFGGIWDNITDAGGVDHPTFSIVTVEPNDATRSVHDRAPLMLPTEVQDQWIQDDLTDSDIKQLMIPYPHPENLQVYAVSDRINKADPETDDERCIEAVEMIGTPQSAPFRM